MFEKWDKYWTSGNMLLAMACVLDPRCKLGVVKYYVRMMYPDEADAFIVALKTYMDVLFEGYVQAHSTNKPSVRATTSAPTRVSDTRVSLKDFMKGKRVSEPLKSELELYLDDPLDETSLDDELDLFILVEIKEQGWDFGEVVWHADEAVLAGTVCEPENPSA